MVKNDVPFKKGTWKADYFMETNKKEANPIIDVATIVLTLSSIILSQIIFYSGKKELGIFIGLWPPTFVALGTLLKQTFGKPGESPNLPVGGKDSSKGDA